MSSHKKMQLHGYALGMSKPIEMRIWELEEEVKYLKAQNASVEYEDKCPVISKGEKNAMHSKIDRFSHRVTILEKDYTSLSEDARQTHEAALARQTTHVLSISTGLKQTRESVASLNKDVGVLFDERDALVASLDDLKAKTSATVELGVVTAKHVHESTTKALSANLEKVDERIADLLRDADVENKQVDEKITNLRERYDRKLAEVDERIEKLHDLVVALTCQTVPDSSRSQMAVSAQRLAVRTATGQDVELSVPKGRAFVSKGGSASSPSSSSGSSSTSTSSSSSSVGRPIDSARETSNGTWFPFG